MAFFVDKLLKALTATFTSPSQINNEESSPSVTSSVLENSADFNVKEESASFAENMKIMPGIVDVDGDASNVEPCIIAEEMDLLQQQKFSKQSSNVEGRDNIQQCANDVLNDILFKLDSNGLNESLLSYLPLDNTELENSAGDSEFVDAVGIFSTNSNSSSLLTQHEQDNLATEIGLLNNSNIFDGFCIKEEKLLEFSVSGEDVDSNNLEPISHSDNIYDGGDLQQSSTPISDEFAFEAPPAQAANLSNLINFNNSVVGDELKRENGEVSFDSFETAISNMSTEDRPISSKGQYSLAELEKLIADEAALESLDPFGGRASTKNKTFTRKTTKPMDELLNSSVEGKEDMNANESSSDLSTNVDTSASVELHTPPAPKGNFKRPDDVANSNVEKTAIATNDKEATPKAEKRVTDETPKKPKAEIAKRDPNPKANPVQTGVRVAGSQQTAVVAPMVNKTESVKAENSLPKKSATKPLPQAINNATSSQSNKVATKQDESLSDDEFVMASSDLFADPSALDYLQRAGSNNVAESDLCRQSLYVKFDPLVGDKMATKQHALNVAKEQAVFKAAAVATAPQSDVVATKKSSKMETADNVHDETLTTDETDTVEKKRKAKDDLLLMKTPSPKVPSGTPTCPPTVVLKKKPGAQARPSGEVDNMLATSPKQQAAVTSEQPETSTQQLKMQFQAYILAKEKEWVTKFKEERERSERMAKELAVLNDQKGSSDKNCSEMKLIVAEYDKTIRDLMTSTLGQLDKQKTNKHGDYDQLVKDKDQALEDLQSVENAFSELHRRYEKLRGSTEDFKKNEEKLRECVADLQTKLKHSEEKFRRLKDHAEEKLEAANTEIDRLQKAKESDTLALRALVKKRDLQVESLEKSLEQKQKEIQELSSICDELIQKVDYPQNTKNSGV